MPSDRVCFIYKIPRNDRLFRCCQRSIIIRSARTPERAIEGSKKRFARLEGISDWKIHAALIEIEPIEVEKEQRPCSRRHAEADGFGKRIAAPVREIRKWSRRRLRVARSRKISRLRRPFVMPPHNVDRSRPICASLHRHCGSMIDLAQGARCETCASSALSAERYRG